MKIEIKIDYQGEHLTLVSQETEFPFATAEWAASNQKPWDEIKPWVPPVDMDSAELIMESVLSRIPDVRFHIKATGKLNPL